MPESYIHKKAHTHFQSQKVSYIFTVMLVSRPYVKNSTQITLFTDKLGDMTISPLLIFPLKTPFSAFGFKKAWFRVTQKMKQKCSKATGSQNHSADPILLTPRFVSWMHYTESTYLWRLYIVDTYTVEFYLEICAMCNTLLSSRKTTK